MHFRKALMALLPALLLVEAHLIGPRDAEAAAAVAVDACSKSLHSVSQITALCTSFLASEKSLRATTTKRVTKTKTLATPTSTQTITHLPTVTATSTSTFLTNTITTIPVTTTITSTITSDGGTTTTTTTISALMIPTSPTKRDLQGDQEKRSEQKMPSRASKSGFHSIVKYFGAKTVTDICFVLLYGKEAEPTTTVTLTKSKTKTPSKVTSTVTKTLTTAIAITTTTTTTVTSFTSTFTASPSSTVTSTTTFYSISTIFSTSTVPASQATGVIALGSPTSGNDAYVYYDYYGGFISADGRGTPGIFCYDVASLQFSDCTDPDTAGQNIFGTDTGVSYLFLGTSSEGEGSTPLQCSLASAANADGNTPLECVYPAQGANGAISSNFCSKSGQDALYYPTDQASAVNQGCTSLNFYFQATSFS